MWISVPQMAVLDTSMRTSLWPTSGSAMSSSQMPGSASFFTSAFMRPPLLADDAEFAAHGGKGVDGPVEVFPVVSGGHLRADARLAVGHHRIGETDHVDAVLQQPVGHLPGQACVAQHHRDDGVLARQQVEAERFHAAAEVLRVGRQLLAQAAVGLEQIHHLYGGSGDHRRQGIREEVGAGALPQPGDDLAPPGGEAAGGAAQRLAQRAGDDVHPAHHVAVLVGTAALPAEEAGGVAVVDHHQRFVFVGQIADALQIGDGAVHGEYAVGGDQAHARVLRRAQLFLQVRHVVVSVAIALRLAQTDAVYDAGVIQRVADDGVLRSQQGLEQPAVGIETGGVEDRVLGPQEVADAAFQLLVHRLGPADEAHRCHAVAVLVDGPAGRGDDLRMVGQPQVVVGAEIDDVARVAVLAHVDLGLLGPGDHPFLLVQALFLQLLGRFGQRCQKRFFHLDTPCLRWPEVYQPWSWQHLEYGPARRDNAGMTEDALRIDKWLWHTRFFKTRGLAAKAVAGGHVHVNGERVKASRTVRVGDRLEITRDRLTWRLTVLTLPPRRGPAREAEACYHEEEGSRLEREALIETLRQDRRAMPRTDGRPDKHTRRELRRLNRKA